MKLSRFKTLKKELDDRESVADVLLDEEFIPPNKSAAFTPYDAIVCIYKSSTESIRKNSSPSLNRVVERNSTSSVESHVKEELLSDVAYDRVTGVTDNHTAEDGDYLAYISLESFEEYKERWDNTQQD